MRPRRFSSEAIVLRRRNYKEADRILTIYSKNFGKLRVLARGIRKPQSRKRGHVEVFSQIRFSASVGKTWHVITEAELIESFPKIRANLKKVAVAYFLMEAVGRLTHYEEKNEELYNLTLETLKNLSETGKLKTLRRDFIYKSLVFLGFWPAGKALSDSDKVLREVAEREISSIRVGKRLLEGDSVVE